jgi:hypothetical protein
MDVAGLAISAIGFGGSAIKAGTTLYKLFKDCGDAGKHVYNATQRLKTQQFTLELWKRTWEAKAMQQHKATAEDGFNHLWGEKGYEMIVQCLAQLNLKFSEAFRTLASIDPDSFTDATSAGIANEPEQPTRSTSSLSSSVKSGTESLGAEGHTTAESDKNQKGAKKTWHTRLYPSKSNTSKPKRFWRRKRSSSIYSDSGESPTAAEKAELAQQALQQKLSPGTKFLWSVTKKEQIRSLVNDIDDWLSLLQTLSTQCESEGDSKKGPVPSNPSSIRAAAKALYAALNTIPSGHALDLKLEKERADSTYFENVVGPLEYFDHSNKSFKFPLLVSSNQNGEEPFLLVAEAMYSSAITTPLLSLDKETSLAEIVDSFKNRTTGGKLPATTLLFRSKQTTIVIHGISRVPTSTQALREASLKCTFAELLQAEAGVNPLVAHSKRLQLACIIAISVLHLYETGWISEQLETNDFHFFGAPNTQYHELNKIAPYVSALASKANPIASPFECLRRNQIPPSLLGSRDERLATLFHRLGIVLFELGRGLQYSDIFQASSPSESDVLAEIERIQFGRPYRDVVKVCLTGSLYATSAINIDSQFDRAVIEK